MGRSDEELVEACQAGEASAFDVLVARWEDRIRGAAYRILGSEDEARDVAQEAFLKAYRGLSGFKREARFSSWLYQIATNQCRDRLRRRKTRPQVSLEALEEAGAAPIVEMRPGAHERLQERDLAEAVKRAIHALPEEQRQALGAGIPFPSRLGTPEEYAQLALQIVANSMLNGETIRLDGALRMPPK